MLQEMVNTACLIQSDGPWPLHICASPYVI